MDRRTRPESESEGEVANAQGVGERLDAFLSASAPTYLARVLEAFARAAEPVAHLIRRGGLAGVLDGAVGSTHDRAPRRALDVLAEEAFIAGLKGAGVRGVVSKARDDPVAIDPRGTLLAAIDPLGGSSNIGANISIGAVFSVLDAPPGKLSAAHFLQPGVNQRAAGFLLFGPHVDFVFTTGAGVCFATLDPETNGYRISRLGGRVPADSCEFAINASNSRHWSTPVRAYVEDLIEGDEGPRGRNYNMRWIGSLVAEAYRILTRGGVYLYPEDSRAGYEHGRLSLLCEANPIAFLVEQAGGAATDGVHRILEIAPKALHQRTPLIFGSKAKVERICRYYAESGGPPNWPLFASRGLLRRQSR